MEANGRNPGNFDLKQVPRLLLCYMAQASLSTRAMPVNKGLTFSGLLC
jgi:hypothetical protein